MGRRAKGIEKNEPLGVRIHLVEYSPPVGHDFLGLDKVPLKYGSSQLRPTRAEGQVLHPQDVDELNRHRRMLAKVLLLSKLSKDDGGNKGGQGFYLGQSVLKRFNQVGNATTENRGEAAAACAATGRAAQP